MRRVLVYTFLFFCSTLSFAQKQWLVTAQMDSVFGKIYLNTGDPYKADEAVVKQDKEKTSYKCFQVQQVHLGNGQDFEALKIDGRYQFVQIDSKGKYVSQYLYKDVSLGTNANFAMKILVNWKGEQFKSSNLTSRKKFAEFFEECPSVSERIESGELKKGDLENIFAAYDQCIEAMNNTPSTPVVVATQPQKPETPAAPVIQTPPAVADDMNAFIEELKSENLFEGDLMMMINDINQKLANGQTVPKYLEGAVLEQLEGKDEFKSKFLKLLE